MGYPIDWQPSEELYHGGDSFRYTLGKSGNRVLICFGVNPSVATEDKPDATIHRLIRVCQKFGFDSYIMLNPSPIRSTKPSNLPQTEEPFAEYYQKNLEYIESIFSEHPETTALATWGNSVDIRPYLKSNVCKIYTISKKYNIHWRHLASLTQKGHPRHLMTRFTRKQFDQALLEPLDMEKYIHNFHL